MDTIIKKRLTVLFSQSYYIFGKVLTQKEKAHHTLNCLKKKLSIEDLPSLHYKRNLCLQIMIFLSDSRWVLAIDSPAKVQP